MTSSDESIFLKKLFDLRFKILNEWQPVFMPKITQSYTSFKNLYHYTTVAGLFGIVENNCFWLTNLKYMNDSSELIHAWQIIKNTINDLKNSTEFCPFFKELLDIIYNDKQHHTTDYYAACFTHSGDYLPMWNMYGKESGVSIEINLLSNFNFTYGPNCFFYDMIYDESILEKFVRFVIRTYYEEYLKENNKVDFNIIKTAVIREILFSILFYENNFKNKNFSYENETRLLYYHHSETKIKYRVKNGIIVSYVEQPIPTLNKDKKLPITSITIGPGENQHLVKTSVEDFMNAKGYNNIEIKISTIPYRNKN